MLVYQRVIRFFGPRATRIFEFFKLLSTLGHCISGRDFFDDLRDSKQTDPVGSVGIQEVKETTIGKKTGW